MSLGGRVVVPASPEYERERKLWNSRYDDVRPSAIVQVASAEDVRRVVAYARPYYAKSDVAKTTWPSTGIETVVAWLEEREREPRLSPVDFDSDRDVGRILIEIADGAIGAVPADATAFPHRDSLFVSQYEARWRKGASPELEAANIAWACGLYEALEPYRSGSSYLGYIDRELEDWQQAY